MLGRGGFGITYLAKDINLDQLVAIKEYLPHDYASRSGDSTVQPVSKDHGDVYDWGLERFMSEAQTLAKFKHPNIVRVLSVFKDNNTGYIVMEYEQGEDLSTIYKQKKQLTQHELEAIYYPIIDGLASVHKEGFIHRDIKPSNIYIRDDGSPVLIDFGAARHAVGTKTRTLTAMLSVGYAPFEQYNDASGKQGPWTDIYALGASLHQGITGAKPLESTIRGMALLHNESDPYQPLSHSNIKGFSHAFLRAIDQSLMLQIHDRPQNLEEFLGMLKGEISLPDLPVEAEKVIEATVIRQRTVVRPLKQKVSDIDIDLTEPGQDIQPEKLATTLINPPKEESAERIDNQPIESSPTRQGQSKYLKYFLVMAGIATILVSIIIFLPGQQPPVDAQKQQIEGLLKKADELLANGKYYDNTGNAALGIFQKILAIEPSNLAAKNGIDKVTQYYLSQAEQSIDTKNFAQANTSLKVVKSINPDFPGLQQALGRFSEEFDAEKKLAKIELLMSQANAALNQNRLYQPEGKNALLYFQNVLQLDPDHELATQGISDIANSIIDRAQTALDKNDTSNAETLVSLAESLDPDIPAIPVLRQKLNSISEYNKLLASAENAFAKKRYTTPENGNAYQLYTQVLDIQPSNPVALQRLKQIANYYADKTRSSIKSGKLASADTSLNVLTTLFPKDAQVTALKSAIRKKRSQIKSSKVTAKKQSNTTQLIPVGVNQKQDDYQVVQDIVGLYINAFNKKDIKALLKVTQLSGAQQKLYSSIFKVYRSLRIDVVPNSFTLRKNDGVANVKFEISELVDSNGNTAETTASWTRMEIKINKKNGTWLKAITN